MKAPERRHFDNDRRVTAEWVDDPSKRHQVFRMLLAICEQDEARQGSFTDTAAADKQYLAALGATGIETQLTS